MTFWCLTGMCLVLLARVSCPCPPSLACVTGCPDSRGPRPLAGIIALAGRDWLEKKFIPWFGPVALLALIYTVLVLFALQVRQLDHCQTPLSIALMHPHFSIASGLLRRHGPLFCASAGAVSSQC